VRDVWGTRQQHLFNATGPSRLQLLLKPGIQGRVSGLDIHHEQGNETHHEQGNDALLD